MCDPRAFTRWHSLMPPPRLLQTRGAVFLLSVYLFAMILLLLTGITMQRTMTEVRSAQISRDLQQAFYVADGGVDTIIRQLRNGSFPIQDNGEFGGPYSPLAAPIPCASAIAGINATCQVIQSSQTIRPQDGTPELVYDIIATGQTNTDPAKARTAKVMATVKVIPIIKRGIFTNGGLTTQHRDWRWDDRAGSYMDEATIIDGNIYSSATDSGAIFVGVGTTIQGNVTVPPPKMDGNYPSYDTLKDFDNSWAAINLETTSTWTRIYYDRDYQWWTSEYVDNQGTITGTVSQAVTAPPIPPLTAPSGICEGQKLGDGKILPLQPLVVDQGTQTIGEGDALNKSTVPGHIEICVPYVKVAADAKLVFTKPTTLYTTWLSNYDYAFENKGTVDVTTGSTRLDRGLSLIVVTPPDARWGAGVELGNFTGSVYAPSSNVNIGPNDRELNGTEWERARDGYTYGTTYAVPPRRDVGFIAARNVYVYGVNLGFGTGYQTSTVPPDKGVSLQSWTVTVTEASRKRSVNGSAWYPEYESPASYNPSWNSGSGGGGGKIICTELFHQGYIPPAWYAADVAYSRAYIDGYTRSAYFAWATPLVAWMRQSAFVTWLVRPLGVAWAQHMAFLMGVTEQDSYLGRVLNNIGVPLNYWIGKYLLKLEPVG